MQNSANFGIAHLNSELKNIAKIELVFGIKNWLNEEKIEQKKH